MESISRPIIGILGVPAYDDEKNSIIALLNDYKNAVVKKKCIPFMICPLLNIDYYGTKISDIPDLTEQEKKIYKEMIDMCDGIIMPGGYRMYNFDEFMVKYAIEKNIPVLGICMGMQLLANIDNGSYCLEANDTNINHKQQSENFVHNVNIVNNTLLSEILNEKEIRVNSNHRYHVAKVNNFTVSAYSEDGLIEGIEMPNKKFVVGLQWHPERMIEYDENANKIFDKFVDECNNIKSKKHSINKSQ